MGGIILKKKRSISAKAPAFDTLQCNKGFAQVSRVSAFVPVLRHQCPGTYVSRNRSWKGFRLHIEMTGDEFVQIVDQREELLELFPKIGGIA